MIQTETRNKADHVMKIIRIMTDKFGIDENALTYQASFSDDLNIDSLDLLELMMDIEKEFKLKIPDEELEKLSTVGSVIDYVDRHVH